MDFDTPMERLCGLFDSSLPDSSDMLLAVSSAIQSASPACSVHDLQPDLIEKLFRMWRVEPFVCSSAYRSEEWERSRHRSGKSSHCKGLAVDIVCCDNVHRFKVVETALAAGFTRIGIAKNFVHVDCDESKPQQRIWTYNDQNKERLG